METVNFPVTVSTSNKALKTPINIEVDKATAARFEQDRVVLGLAQNSKSVLIIMKDGHHAKSGDRGLGMYVGNYPSLDRPFKQHDFDYTREAFFGKQTTGIRKPTLTQHDPAQPILQEDKPWWEV